ncbi:MAG: maleylpyruvate isomerase family mycothiol-dependent enzyme [Acidimicrobiales bacterium]
MIIEREIDAAGLYEQTRLALLELVRSLSPEQQSTPVPATPAWSVLDVVAHVVGITADLRAGSFGPGDQDAWTAAQVASRRGRSIDALAAEWDDEAPGFEAGLRAFGYEMGSHFLGDLLQHVSDVRHALGQPRIPDDVTLLVALDFYLDSFDGGLHDAEVGSVAVRTGDDEWVLGSGPVVATWKVDRFECFRSLGGRRDEAQIRAQPWTGDVDAIVPRVSRYGMPERGIVEP